MVTRVMMNRDGEKTDKTSLHMAGTVAHQIWVECDALQYFLVVQPSTLALKWHSSAGSCIALQ